MTGSVYSVRAAVTGMLCGLAAQHSRHTPLCRVFLRASVVVLSPVGRYGLSHAPDGEPSALPEVHDSVTRIAAQT